MVITLLEKSIASVGYKFTHLGGTKICKKCPLNKVCVDSLEKNKSYIITEVRENEHTCLIENQVMVVCEVEETSSVITVEDQKFLENIILNRSPLECNEILCENYEYCLNPSYQQKTKIKILKTIKKIDCPLNYHLVLAEVKKVEK